MINTKHLLLVEDDAAVASAVTLHLEQAGFDCSHETNGKNAVDRITQGRFDLLLLDLGLPGMDGLEVCRRVREIKPDLPVIILSARSHEAHKVLGLELGADDYITKPFSMVEVTARVRSLLRRLDQLKQNPQQQILELTGGMKIDPTKRQVWLHDKDVELTLREFDLLHFLASNSQRAFSRAQLIEQVWGASFDGYEHAVNSHINRLRAKIETDPRDPKWVITVWGMGYRFQTPTST